MLAGFICSCSIEALQHITQTGYLQLDDVMTNTIGTILGWLAYQADKSPNDLLDSPNPIIESSIVPGSL